MNRPALEALRDSLRQAVGTTVSPVAVCVLLDALLAPAAAAGTLGDLRQDPYAGDGVLHGIASSTPPLRAMVWPDGTPMTTPDTPCGRGEIDWPMRARSLHAATRPVALWETA